MKELLLKQPQILPLHECPNNLDPVLKGNDAIRLLIEQSGNTIVFCGHKNWEETVIQKANGVQIINLDSKCLILKVIK